VCRRWSKYPSRLELHANERCTIDCDSGPGNSLVFGEQHGVSYRMSKSHRGNNFDFIRLMLAILVILSHSYALGTGSERNEPINLITRGQTTSGGLAVDSFFILSGFLITQSWQRSRSIWSYLRKRVARIYPAFIVAMALCLFVVCPLSNPKGWSILDSRVIVDYFVHTANLDGTPVEGTFSSNVYPGEVNGSIWSIRFEFWCYIGLAALGMLGMLKRPRPTLLLFLTFIFIHLGFDLTHWNPGFKIVGRILGWPLLWARVLPLFMAGVMYAVWEPRMPLHGRWAAAALLMLAIGTLIPHGWTVLFPVAGAYFLFWLSQTPLLPMNHFGRYGDFSYGTYLYAFPIQQMLVLGNGGAMDPRLLFSVATPISLLAGFASWYLIERHFLRSRTKVISPDIPVVSLIHETAGAQR
jgi:peptidoglycan/LPS O-acetylase OafA/YrhL